MLSFLGILYIHTLRKLPMITPYIVIITIKNVSNCIISTFSNCQTVYDVDTCVAVIVYPPLTVPEISIFMYLLAGVALLADLLSVSNTF